MASGTQNLPPAACNKTQNKKIIGNGWWELFCQSLIIQCNNYCYIRINIKMIPLYFRPSKPPSPHHNFQLILFHDRGTSAPPVFISLCTVVWTDVTQCHLFKGSGRNVFGNCQRLDLAGKFQYIPLT